MQGFRNVLFHEFVSVTSLYLVFSCERSSRWSHLIYLENCYKLVFIKSILIQIKMALYRFVLPFGN